MKILLQGSYLARMTYIIMRYSRSFKPLGEKPHFQTWTYSSPYIMAGIQSYKDRKAPLIEPDVVLGRQVRFFVYCTLAVLYINMYTLHKVMMTQIHLVQKQ